MGIFFKTKEEKIKRINAELDRLDKEYSAAQLMFRSVSSKSGVMNQVKSDEYATQIKC